jgi:hypothetical protein
MALNFRRKDRAWRRSPSFLRLLHFDGEMPGEGECLGSSSQMRRSRACPLDLFGRG